MTTSPPAGRPPWGENRWIGAGAVAIGCWIVLDAVFTWRRGDSERWIDEELSTDESRTLMADARRVVETLREASGPLSAKELRERIDLAADDLEDALEAVVASETV